MLDRTDHNRLAGELSQRLVELRVREIEAFERRASGLSHAFVPHTAATAAKVATQLGASPMNVHQSEYRNSTSLLQPAVSSSAFLKAGTLGFQGGGKTLTSALLLIGLFKHTLALGLHDGSKPVAMIDTEKGSDWLIPIFKAAGVPFVVAKRKSFADLLTVGKEAEAAAFGLLIDSITHPWREIVESYLRKKERSYLTMDDWGYLKGEHGWQKFTDFYVNSKLHIVMAGRAGYEYENYVEDGRKKMEKVGTKMKTEGETGFEPDLLILMEQVEDMRTGKVGHRATVQKDRSTYLDGQQFTYPAFNLGEDFENPVFRDFLPHIQCLALGSPHVGVGVTGDSQHLLNLQKRDWQPVQRKIVLCELQDLLVQHAGGQTIADKQRRIALLKAHFNGCGYVEIEETMPLVDLRAGYDSLHQELEKKPSRYASAIAKDTASTEINDGLPGDMAPVPLAAATGAVIAALADAPIDTVTVNANGIPAFLDRTASAEPEADEPKWLAELQHAFGNCVDFVSFVEKQQTLVAPMKPKVTKATWNKAVKIVSACMARIMESGGAVAVAAE